MTPFLPIDTFWGSWYNPDTMRLGWREQYVPLWLLISLSSETSGHSAHTKFPSSRRGRHLSWSSSPHWKWEHRFLQLYFPSHSQNNFSLFCSLSFSLYTFLNRFWHRQECGRFCSTAINRETTASDVWKCSQKLTEVCCLSVGLIFAVPVFASSSYG